MRCVQAACGICTAEYTNIQSSTFIVQPFRTFFPVQVHHWMPLMLEHIATLKGQPNATVCALVTMSGLSLAAARASRPVRREHLELVAEWLASEDMRSLQHPELQRQLAMVVSNVIDLAGSSVTFVSKPLFHSLMHLQGHALDEYTTKQILEVRFIPCPRCVHVACLILLSPPSHSNGGLQPLANAVARETGHRMRSVIGI